MLDSLPADLARDVDRAGYHPQIVRAGLATALGGRPLRAHLVHPETTFDGDGIRRHLTALLLTDAHLIAAHVDDEPPVEGDPHPVVMVTSDTVALSRVRHLTLGLVFPTDAPRGRAASREVSIGISWDGNRRLDLEPAQCADPHCDADHGFSGTSSPSDVLLRVSGDAEGDAAVKRALAFYRVLDAATHD